MSSARTLAITSTAVGAALVMTLSGCSSSKPAASTTSPPTTPATTATVTHTAAPSSTTATTSAPVSTTPASTGQPADSAGSQVVGPAGGPVPTGFKPMSASYISANQAWVLGTAPCSTAPCTSIVRTANGGGSWVGIPAPKAQLIRPGDTSAVATTQLRFSVNQLRFADANDGWAAGGGLYSTHDGGAHWKSLQIGAASTAVTAIGTGGGEAYAVISGCAGKARSGCSSEVYAAPIHSDQFVPVAPIPAAQITPTQFTVHGADWFLITATNLYHGRATAHATVSNLPTACVTTLSRPVALTAADVNHLDLLCGGNGGGGSSGYQLYGTTNSGHTWTTAGSIHLLPSGMSAISDNGAGVLLFAAASGASELLRTTDDGATISPVFTSPTGGQLWSDAGFTTSQLGFAILPVATMYRTTDAGAQWSAVRF